MSAPNLNTDPNVESGKAASVTISGPESISQSGKPPSPVKGFFQPYPEGTFAPQNKSAGPSSQSKKSSGTYAVPNDSTTDLESDAASSDFADNAFHNSAEKKQHDVLKIGAKELKAAKPTKL